MHFKTIFCPVLRELGLGVVIFNRRLRVKQNKQQCRLSVVSDLEKSLKRTLLLMLVLFFVLHTAPV